MCDTRQPVDSHCEKGSLVKVEFIFPPEIIDQLANKIMERLKPMLSCNEEKGDDAILTIEHASRLLLVSKEQIYQWVNQSRHGLNDFPYMKAGRGLRFSKNKLLQWMEKKARNR